MLHSPFRRCDDSLEMNAPLTLASLLGPTWRCPFLRARLFVGCANTRYFFCLLRSRKNGCELKQCRWFTRGIQTIKKKQHYAIVFIGENTVFNVVGLKLHHIESFL
jgi:hypothetical protein